MSIIDGMILLDFEDGLNHASWKAAQQQAFLLTTSYFHRKGLIERVFTGHPHWRLADYVEDDSTLIPNYFIGQQNRDWFVVMTGTTNVAQMMGNVIGYNAVHFDLQRDVLVNQFWESQWNLVKVGIRHILPSPDAIDTIHVCGHSYGAAVSFLMAVDLAGDYGSDKVEWFGFGSPAVLTDGLTIAKPGIRHRFSNLEDVVAILPPTGVGLSNLSAGQPIDYFTGRLAWTQYGFEHVLSKGGKDRGPQEVNRFFPVSLDQCVASGFRQHMIHEYNHRVHDARKRYA